MPSHEISILDLTSLSLLPLIWLISDPVVDFESPEWRNWAYVFLSFHCLSIVVYKIFSQNLMKNRLRFAAFLTVIVFLFLSPISLLANTLRVLENHDPRSLAGPMYVSYDPIKTTLGEILYELASWHYVAFFTVLLLVALDTRTSLRKGKLLPAIYFLFFVTHSSGLLSAICNNMPPYFELSSSTREFIYETFPRSSKWLFESLIIYPPDGIAWGLHGMDRKEAKRSAISRRARYPARSPLEIYEW